CTAARSPSPPRGLAPIAIKWSCASIGETRRNTMRENLNFPDDMHISVNANRAARAFSHRRHRDFPMRRNVFRAAHMMKFQLAR
ncbi:MAG TPA: hypothetical protein VM915_05875, partial [Verrucomicrobiae bacterium]|nr:hypothetical protein [Verrucomicrobiae bacterium]